MPHRLILSARAVRPHVEEVPVADDEQLGELGVVVEHLVRGLLVVPSHVALKMKALHAVLLPQPPSVPGIPCRDSVEAWPAPAVAGAR